MTPHDADRTGRPSISRRRVLKTAGATAFVGAGLAGCLASGQESPNTVEFAANTDVADMIDEIEAKLHEAGLPDDIHLSALAGVSASGARKQQYNRWLSAGLENPSLYMMDSGWTIPFILRDQLVNLSERRPDLTERVKNEYFQTLVETAQGPNGDLYGIPLFPDAGTILYRKDLVKEAGFSPDDEEWATNPITWKKFSEVAKQTAEQTDTQYGFTFQGAAYEGLSCCDFREFTGTWGGSYFGAKENLFGPVGGRPVTTDSEPVIKATRMVRTFIDGNASNALDSVAGNIAPRAVLQWQEETSRTPFSEGNAVMHRNWPYAINIAGAEDAYGEDLGVMPIPYGVEESEAEFDGYGGTVSALGGWHVALNPNSQKKEMALKVIEAMASEEFYMFLFEELGWLPPVKEMFESQQAQDVPVMGRYLNTLQMAVENAIPRPVTVAWPQQSTKIAQNANSAFSGDGTPKQKMQTLANQLEEIEEQSSREETGSTGSNETNGSTGSNETNGSTPTEQPTTTGGD